MNQQKTINLRVHLMEGQQFLMLDSEWEWWESPDELWNELAFFCHVGVLEHRAIAVMAENELAESIPVTIRVASQAPQVVDLQAWDHIVEVSLRCETGALQVCSDVVEAHIPLPAAGSYRVRVSIANLDTAYDDPPLDTYVIDVWPQEKDEIRVVKWWEPWRPPPPPEPRADRRTIYGIDNYRNALTDLSLTMVSSREVDPAPELHASLPPSYKETLFLFLDKDGTYWEYSTEAPHRMPLLIELTVEEARERYELK